MGTSAHRSLRVDEGEFGCKDRIAFPTVSLLNTGCRRNDKVLHSKAWDRSLIDGQMTSDLSFFRNKVVNLFNSLLR